MLQVAKGGHSQAAALSRSAPFPYLPCSNMKRVSLLLSRLSDISCLFLELVCLSIGFGPDHLPFVLKRIRLGFSSLRSGAVDPICSFSSPFTRTAAFVRQPSSLRCGLVVGYTRLLPRAVTGGDQAGQCCSGCKRGHHLHARLTACCSSRSWKVSKSTPGLFQHEGSKTGGVRTRCSGHFESGLHKCRVVGLTTLRLKANHHR